MRDKPALSILIPWYERDELRLTLAANEPVFRAHEAEILILNCGGGSERLRALIAASEVTGVRQLDLSVSGFNKSLALNAGLAHARADSVFILDTDIILLSRLPLQELEEGCFITIESVYESALREAKQAGDDTAATTGKSAILEFTFRDGAKIRHQFGLRDAAGNIRAGTGLLLANKRDLLNIQGFNSDLEFWGWEDDDVLVRLQYALKRRRVQSGAALHLTHDNNRRFVRGSRGQSDQRNFIKCCRNYNNGIFLGSYGPDIANLSGKVSETHAEGSGLVALPDGRASASGVGPARAAGVTAQNLQNNPIPAQRPMYCGIEGGMTSEMGRDWTKWPPPLSALLAEATLIKTPLDGCDVLQIGGAGSRLAAQLSPRCRQITGVARNERELTMAAGTDLKNYQAVVCNQYSQTFRDCLPLHSYDVILDCSMTSHACCERHLRTLMENYASLLSPAGWLLTVEPGLDSAASDNSCELTEPDLAVLAAQFSLYVSKAGPGIYKVARQKKSNH